MSRVICFIDFETTGKDSKICRPTEIGAALVDVDNYKVIANTKNLIYAPDYAPLEAEVLEVCPHITDDILKAEGISFVQAVVNLIAMFNHYEWPEYIIAHNSDYDEDVMRNEMARFKENLKSILTDDELQKLWSLKWLCSIRDIPYNPRFTCKKLSHLALDLGVNMQGRALHSALDDVLLLVDMLEAAKVDWKTVISRAKVPFVIVKAMIPPPFGKGNDGGKGKDACKLNKFRWQEIGDFSLTGSWLKRIKEDEIDNEASILGYPLHVVKTL